MKIPFKDAESRLNSIWGLVCEKKGDGTTSFSPVKFLFYVGILSCLAAYVHRAEIFNYLAEIDRSRVIKQYNLEEHLERQEQLTDSIVSSVDGLYSLVPNTSLVTFFAYRPEDFHMFSELLYYKGDLPNNQTIKDFRRVTVDTSRGDYIEHLKGLPYNPSGKQPKSGLMDKYVYSCPVFRVKDSMYYAKISIYWDTLPEKWNLALYYTSCSRAAREIGKYL